MADTGPPTHPKAEAELPAITQGNADRLLTHLLRGVSRTFYLTIRVLPTGLRQPIGLAYLLARAADTIADSRLLPPSERVKHLLALRAQVEGPASIESLTEIGLALTGKGSTPAERSLLTSLPVVFSMLEASPHADRIKVRSVVMKLTRGMEMDLNTFPSEDSGRIAALKDPNDLDRYTYYVAGCVGEFWTAITITHTPSLRHWDVQRMSAVGVRFGKALQLTNVLRDVARDLRIGRCYFPQSELALAGLTPEQLLDPSVGAKARPLLVSGMETALEHYGAAEEYILAIPRRCLRLRLAVLWPVLIGLATLAKLAANEDWLDPTRPSKVSRRWVYTMLLLSLPRALSNSGVRAWIRRLRRRVEQAL